MFIRFIISISSSADDFIISYNNPRGPGVLAFLVFLTLLKLMLHFNGSSWAISSSFGKAFTSLTNFDWSFINNNLPALLMDKSHI